MCGYLGIPLATNVASEEILLDTTALEALADLDNVNLVKLVLGFRLEPIFTTVKVTTKTSTSLKMAKKESKIFTLLC